MNWEYFSFYAGYVIALALCYGLGQLFFLPMLLNLIFNVCLTSGLFADWDIRWIVAVYGMLFFVWVLTLSGLSHKSTIVLVIAADLFVAFQGMWPQLTLVGSGGTFWDTTSTGIIHVWLTSILVVTCSTIVRGTLLSKVRQGYIEVLAVPKQRFQIPIALWSGCIVLPYYLHDIVPEWLFRERFVVAAQLLVWGWVAFELPFYLMYKRINARGS